MENEYQSFAVEVQDTTEVNTALSVDNHEINDASTDSEKSIAEANAALIEEPEVVNETSLLSRVESAYCSLQIKFSDHQRLLLESRSEIMALRHRIKELVLDTQANPDEHEDELHQCKLSVQHDDCATLITHAEQIREHIYNNSNHAISLLTPLKASVELLELRLKHIRALEQLLENIKLGLAMQDRLLEIDLLIESLASKLDIV